MTNPNQDVPTSAEVVVIGGGVVGTSVAYFLSRAGVRVCLLERDDIGAGTTSAAAAAALLQTKTSAVKLALASESLALLDKLHDEFEQSFEFEHSGSLLAACSETELQVVQDVAATLQRLGLAVRMVDGAEAREMMPILGPTVVGASFSPADAQVNPLELVVAYANTARRLGAQLCTGVQVIGIEKQGAHILSVVTNKGKIRTDTVVNAAGVWATHVAQLVGLEIPVAPLKGELLITQAMPRRMRGTLISAKYLLSKTGTSATTNATSSKRTVGITLVQVARGNFLVGSTREPAGYDSRNTYTGISELCRLLTDITPSLANVHIIRAYAGLRPLTPDLMPIIGCAPSLPGFIAATGHGGDGLAFSAITGKIVSEIFTGTADPGKLNPFAWERFNAN